MDLKALHKIGYGLYVVTSVKGEKLNGQIANTVFQITSEPPTVAVSINKSNLTWEFIEESRVFAVSVLRQDTPLDFIGRFGFKSGRDTDKLEGVNYKTGQTKSPIVIDNAVSYLEVEVVNEMDMGTHTVFAGRVVDAEVLTDEACMTYEYYHQIKRGVTPKTAPSYIEEKKAEAPSWATRTVVLPPVPHSSRCRTTGYVLSAGRPRTPSRRYRLPAGIEDRIDNKSREADIHCH
jgi:ferric-chelate reductase [NAD(P)H]